MEKLRLDKLLWMTRIYKTRNIALEACKKNNIRVNSIRSKPSKMIVVNDTLSIKKNYIEYRYKIIDLPKARLSAKDINQYIKDLTLKEELDKLEERKKNYSIQFKREKGLGRPTKKDRRIMDKFINEHD